MGNEIQPLAIKPLLGWVLLGPADKQPNRYLVNNTLAVVEEESLTQLTEAMYNHEFEDLASNEKEWSAEEKRTIELVRESTCFQSGRYAVPLPWRDNGPALKDNREYAYKWLLGLKGSLNE